MPKNMVNTGGIRGKFSPKILDFEFFYLPANIYQYKSNEF